MESFGILCWPIVSGSHSACEPAPVSPAKAGVSCRLCAQTNWVGNEIAARPAAITTAQTMREALERVRTDFSLVFRKPTLTRFTVKIRTPSLLSRLTPQRLQWGKLDYMGAKPLGASPDSPDFDLLAE